MSSRHDPAVAIIGMAGRFPGAADVDELWSLFAAGQSAIRPVDAELLRAEGVDAAVLNQAGYVPRACWIDAIDQFDARFFGLSPQEAIELDPQQRLLLQCSYHALESAGYAPRSVALISGIYIGVKRSTYYLRNLQPEREIADSLDDARIELAASGSFAATRIAHALNLTGPVMTVDSACSSSLLAVHLAARALIGYECDLALAGAANITVPQRIGYRYLEGGAFSSDGSSRSFDAQACGTVLGNAVGIVVLKRLTDAIAAGDPIIAVIRGSAVNNDGSRKVGFWAPGVRGQTQVVLGAQQLAGVSANAVTYVEAHGMGTLLGDAAEVMALTDAFRMSTARSAYCALTSSRPNVGHLEAAGGVISLIKVALAQQHAQIPPSAAVTTPNPGIDWPNTPFYVNRELREWPIGADGQRIGAVSSFGIGGTNVHVIVEQAPLQQRVPASNEQAQLWPISAMSAAQCDQIAQRVTAHAREHSLAVADVAFTLQTGREQFAWRGCMVLAAGMAVPNDLPDELPGGIWSVAPLQAPLAAPRLVWMFAGEARAASLLAGLGSAPPALRERVEHTLERLRRVLDVGAQSAHPQWSVLQAFAIGHALSQYLTSLGVSAAGVLGEGIGELTAACSAGVLSFEDALRLLAARQLPATLGAVLAQVRLQAPRCPLISVQQGRALSATEATDPYYWARLPLAAHSRNEGVVAALRNMSAGLLLDLMGGESLQQWLRDQNLIHTEILGTAHGAGLMDQAEVMTLLGRLWQRGCTVHWEALHGAAARRVRLPGYAFATTRYWAEPVRTAWAARQQSLEPPPPPQSLTSIESVVARIWGELLGFDRIGREENFFALGGHSLLAGRIAVQLREQLRIEVPPSAIFEQPSIAALSAYLEEQRTLAEHAVLEPLTRRDREPPVVSFAQERLWLLERLEGPSGVYNEGCALLIEGPLQVEILEQALQLLAVRHATLRSSFSNDGGRPRLQIATQPVLHLRQLDAAEGADPTACLEHALELIDAEGQRPFDLESGPLLRCVRLQLQPQLHVFGLFVHHIVCDGLSIAIVCRDLIKLYQSLRQERVAELPALPVQYPDFAAWQRRVLTAQRLAPHLEFWRERLHGATAMPLAESHGDRHSRKGAVHRFVLSPELLERVRQLAGAQRTTTFVVLLGCFQLLLAARCGARDILVTTPVTERHSKELQELVGLFVNSVVLRQVLEESWSVGELLGALHATQRAALAHQCVPFEQILDIAAKASGDREAVAGLLSQARLVYLEDVPQRVCFEGLVATVQPLLRRLAKFDLLLTVQRDAQQCRADLEYRTEVFSASYIADFADQLALLLERVTLHPELRVGVLLQELQSQQAVRSAAGREEQRSARRKSLQELRREVLAR